MPIRREAVSIVFIWKYYAPGPAHRGFPTCTHFSIVLGVVKERRKGLAKNQQETHILGVSCDEASAV
jgi:hypothetical protein